MPLVAQQIVVRTEMDQMHQNTPENSTKITNNEQCIGYIIACTIYALYYDILIY